MTTPRSSSRTPSARPRLICQDNANWQMLGRSSASALAEPPAWTDGLTVARLEVLSATAHIRGGSASPAMPQFKPVRPRQSTSPHRVTRRSRLRAPDLDDLYTATRAPGLPIGRKYSAIANIRVSAQSHAV